MNIVVAVLLDEFISTVAREKAENRQKKQEELEELKHTDDQPEGPLDPLVRGLLTYTNQDDLMRRISNLYARLDRNHDGIITRAELTKSARADADVRSALGLPQEIRDACGPSR